MIVDSGVSGTFEILIGNTAIVVGDFIIPFGTDREVVVNRFRLGDIDTVIEILVEVQHHFGCERCCDFLTCINGVVAHENPLTAIIVLFVFEIISPAIRHKGKLHSR